MTQLIQHFIDALSVGSTYALLALGLTLLFGVMGLINFAYGDVIVWCGYAFSVLASIGVGFWWAIPLVVVWATLLSLAIWYLAFRPFHSASPITLLLSSFGVALALEAAAVMIFGQAPRVVSIPDGLSHVIFIGGLRMPVIEIVTLATGAVVVISLFLLLNRTTLGLEVLATAENRSIAELLGVRGGRTIFAVFAISGVLVGLVAVLWLAPLGAVTPTVGLTPTLKAFIAIVLGGLGSIRGAVAGGLGLGALEVFMNAWLPNALLPYQDALVFAAVILIVSLRPGGIAGRVPVVTR
jgi:branched-chain amino acid transport system permease protein